MARGRKWVSSLESHTKSLVVLPGAVIPPAYAKNVSANAVRGEHGSRIGLSEKHRSQRSRSR